LSCKGDILNESSVIQIRLKKDPERINPLIFPNPVAREIYQYIHLPLADYNPESLELEPLLIQNIPTAMSIDTGQYKGGIYYDVSLIKDAKWENGSPITSEDYLFTMKAINLPLSSTPKYRDLVQNISDIVIDPNDIKKFRVIFKEDYMLALETVVNIEIYPRYFYDSLNVLSNYPFSYLTESNADAINGDSTLVKFAEKFNGNDYSRNLISGSGPYKLVSWTSDQNIVLEKKPDYWGSVKKQPALQQGPAKMIFHIIPDELTAITQLKAGALDVVNEISADSYMALSTDPVYKEQFNFFHPSLTKHYFISVNNQDPLLNDANVRLALGHLIDVDNMIANLENGMAVRSVGPIHPSKKTYNDALAPISFDLDKAKELLASAGWKDTNNNGTLDKTIGGKLMEMELEILISGQELGKRLAIILQENAAKTGVKINIKEKEFKLIRAENLKTRNYQLVPSVLSQDINAWDDLSRWQSSEDTPNGGNESSYRSTATDALIDKILVTKEDDKRIKLYKEIQAQLYADQAAIFLYSPEEKIVISKNWSATSTVKRPGYMANTFKKIANKVPSAN
ncbi:MAG: ABC transporter substrate-binding protein, partial [Saprospiraceae bacterium]